MSTPDDSIKIWLKTGDIDKLEEAVINGYGDQLRNKTSRIPKINHFLKQVPHFQSKIDGIHEAVAQGKLREVQSLLDRKKLAMCRSQTGASPLHTAILNNQSNIAKYILEKFPTAIQARDNQGRTALHYAAVATDEGEMYRILLEYGADKKATDMRGKIPEYYLQNPEELPLKSLREGAAISKVTRRNDRRNDRGRTTDIASISVPSKIEVRMLIQKADLNKLEAIVLNGYGDRLLGESSVNSRVKEFLDQVPEFMIKVANLHAAAVEGSLRDVRNLLDRRTMVTARDPYGANVLHRSVVHNHHNVVKYLVNNYPETINTIDFDGRTPLHYSVAVEDERIYKTLIGAGADESIKDNAGKTVEYYRKYPFNIQRVVQRDNDLASKSKENPSSYYTTLTPNQSSSKSRSQNGPLTAFVVRQWVRNGEVDKLEQLVLEGHGIRLIGESAIDHRTRAFLKQIPIFLNKIEFLHEAVVSGNLRQVKVLLDRKHLAKSKHQGGLGLLHKSLIYNHPHISSYICQSYPEALLVIDNEGRIPLHYAAVINDGGEAYHSLREAGADPLAVDAKGNTAIYYKEHPEELDLLEMQNRINRMRSRMQAIKNSSDIHRQRYGGGLRVTRANIRKWIHAEDVDKLNQVVFEGHGTKLLVETSSSLKVKEFLKSVPNLIAKIRDVHQAAQEGNLADLQQKADSKQLFLSKDVGGISPLHRAVVMGHRDISKYIIQECPDSVKAKDYEGRTPLHYAAALPKDDNVIYNMLLEAGGDNQQLDEKGNSPEYYQQHPAEAELRTTVIKLNRKLPEIHVSSYTTQRKRKPPNTLRLPKNSNKSLKGIAFNTLSPEHVSKLINQGDVDKLEQLVLEGYGKKLYGKTSWIEEVRNFLKKVPSYMDRIYAVHKATAKGDLRQVEELMDNKKLVIAKDERGLTPLHRAVKYGKTDIVKYMLQMYPAAVHEKDKEGRTPLHLAGMYKDRDVEYKLLQSVGADATIIDLKSKTPQQYQESNMKLEVQTPQREDDDTEQKSTDEPTAEEIEDDENINEWIANGDFENLEQLIIDGKGDLLLGKSSDEEKMKEFLECVPANMGKIRAIHNATVEGDLRGLQPLIDKRQYATARDNFGACPLHIALLHGHNDVIRYLGNNFPASMNVQDIDGRTPLHYAAVANDSGLLYRFLHKHGADTNIKDKNGSTPGHYLRGKGESISFEDILKRYEEKKIPPRPPSVQTWQRPPTAEILKALTPDEEENENDESTTTFTETQTLDETPLDATPLTEEMNSEEVAVAEVGEQDSKIEDKNENPNEPEEENKRAEEATEEAAEEPTVEAVEEPTEKATSETAEEPTEEAAEEPTEEAAEEPTEEAAEEPTEEAAEEPIKEATEKPSEEAAEEPSEEAAEEPSEEAAEEPTEEATEEATEVTTEAAEESKDEATTEAAEESKDEATTEAAEKSKDEATAEAPKESTQAAEKPTEEATAEAAEEPTEEATAEAAEEPTKATEEPTEEAPAEAAEKPTEEETSEPTEETSENPTEEASNEPNEEQTDKAQKSNEDNNNNSTEETIVNEPDPQPETDRPEAESVAENTNKTPVPVEENTDDQPNDENNDSNPMLETAALESETKSTAEETISNPVDVEKHEEPTQNNLNSKSTTPTPNGLRPKHLSRNHSSLSTLDNPMWSKEGEYLASAMGDALIKGLTEVSHRRPKDPIGYLAVWLYLHEMRSMAKPSTPYLDKEVDDDDPLMNSTGLEKEEMGKGLYEARLARSSSHRSSRGSISSPADNVNVIGRIKDERGKTILHFAARMQHEGSAFWNLLFYTNCNPAEKDEDYLTARDIAEKAEIFENVNAIDKFVATLIINDKLDMVKELMLNCYENIVDVNDPVSQSDILSTLAKDNKSDMLNLLDNVKSFQNQVENLHKDIVNGDLTGVKDKINDDLAIAKSPTARCSLHIAVLHEQMQIIEYIASSFPNTLKIRDNMWRTPLHYAMGVENSQAIAKILIQYGASRQSRDVKFRTPSYYFVEPQEIANLISEVSLRPTTVVEE